jgi:hypothetical protein
VDFTGGVSETLDLKGNDYSEQEDKRSMLFEKLMEEIKDHSVMCSVITVSHILYTFYETLGEKTNVQYTNGFI